MYTPVETGGKWDFEKKPEFEGVLISKEKKNGQNGKDYWIFNLEEKLSGERFNMWGATLESKLGSIEDGKQVKITYKGLGRGQSGNKYKLFDVDLWSDD